MTVLSSPPVIDGGGEPHYQLGQAVGLIAVGQEPDMVVSELRHVWPMFLPSGYALIESSHRSQDT